MNKLWICRIKGYSFRKITLAVLGTLIMIVVVTMITLLQKHLTPAYFIKGNPIFSRIELSKTLEKKPLVTTLPSVLPKKEVRHIGFLKVHKAASSTMQNIFYRFGLRRNLSFVLPKSGHILSKHKYLHYQILPPFLVNSQPYNHGKYDILCNHVVFNYDHISDLMHDDAVYIAIVREPMSLFLSSAYYYKYVWKFPYLKDLADETFVTDLIREPNKYEAETMAKSMTFNSMAYDFGLDFTHVTEAGYITEETFSNFLTKTGEIFKFVLIVEHFDESLVLLKRYLNWSLSDIIYLPNNVLASRLKGKVIPNITEADKNKFRHRNRFDYGIYEFFKARFEKQFEAEVNIKKETQHFQNILQSTNDFCFNRRGKHYNSTELEIGDSVWNTKFTLTETDCHLMLKNELPFVSMMKSRQQQLRNITME